MAKITLYVPGDLKAEMDGFQSLEPNWSAIAQQAFRAECQLFSNRKRSQGKMDTVIERLRASKTKINQQDYVTGLSAGRKWAMEDAEVDQLEFVAKYAEDAEPGRNWPAPLDAGGWLVSAIGGDLEGNDRADDGVICDFWNKWADTETPSEAFVLAFADGAVEVWNEVADKL